MDGVGLCLFLPRRAHFSCPGPSFVEAVTGLPSETPAREAIEAGTALMHRLTAAGAVLPLNLFGAAGGSVSDQPDFLVTREALPYVFSLIGGRNWKSGPGAKASPLTLEIWKQVEGAGAQTAAELQTALGRELTEAAILRGLVELWNGLRAIPVYDGETTRWELTQARFAEEMTASQKVAQTTALSALVAGYLESAIAASSDEIETFLSPLTSRSRVREVVNGLSATRQLGLVSVAATPLLHVAGTLPEFAEAEPVEVELPARAAAFERKPYERGVRPTREGGAARKPFERAGRSGERRRGFDRGRTGPARERTGSRDRTGPPRERSGFGRGESGRFAARGDAPFQPKAAGGERPYRKPEDGERKPFERKPFGKKPFDKSGKTFRPRSSDGPSGGARGSSRPFDRERSASGGAKPSFGGRAGGGKFGPKKLGAGAGGAKPWQDRGAGRPAESRPERGSERGSGRSAAGAGGRPFRPRPDGDRGGERRGERRPGKFGGEKKFGGPKKFGAGKFGGGRVSEGLNLALAAARGRARVLRVRDRRLRGLMVSGPQVRSPQVHGQQVPGRPGRARMVLGVGRLAQVRDRLLFRVSLRGKLRVRSGLSFASVRRRLRMGSRVRARSGRMRVRRSGRADGSPSLWVAGSRRVGSLLLNPLASRGSRAVVRVVSKRVVRLV